MVMKLTANGQKIKELRLGQKTDLPRKTFAKKCDISERQLQRIENANLSVGYPTLKGIAEQLGVPIEEIVLSVCGPKLVPSARVASPSSMPHADNLATAPGRKTKSLASVEPEMIHIPRHTRVGLAPVASAQVLYELAESSMEIKPHMLVDTAPEQMEMVEECLGLLKAVSQRQWSCGTSIAPDAHDETDFPEISRRRRLAELFVILKGHDVRIVASREMYRYPAGERPWLDGQRDCWHLVVAFAPPRGEWEEDGVSVPFDGGCHIVLPYKPLF